MNSSTFDSRVHRALQGEYQVEERLGHGGTATVYRARPVRNNRTVAIKARPATGDDAAQRFRREIEIHSSLDHPHIARFFSSGHANASGAGSANGGAIRYLAMQHLNGGALGGRLQNQSLSVENACSLLRPVAAALHHAHEQGIVHRDVNPSNILLSEDGQAHLIDFSIALGPDHTPLGDGTLCTPAYMSPEQRGGEGTDPRSDIFSFGIMLYEALTGQKPFGTWMNRGQEVAPPRELVPSVPAELSDVVMRCLERDPNRRIQTARVLADALAPFTNGSSSTNAHSTSQSSRSQSSGTHAEADPDMDRSSARTRNVDPTTAIGFLESRPDFARSLISRWADIPVRMLRAQPDFWDWDALSRNESLSWSASLLDEYARRWDWAALSANEAIPFNGDLIERHERKWDWELLSVNETLPWSADLIRRFRNRWKWGVSDKQRGFTGALSMNRALPWSSALLDTFKHQWDWRVLSGNPALPWTNDLLSSYYRRWTWGVAPQEMVYEKQLYFPTLSANPGLPWTKELVSAHPEVWNWTELSRNPSLPWSKAFLERYRERWSWNALSANEGLPWSRALLNRYEEKWKCWKIATNEGLPWNTLNVEEMVDRLAVASLNRAIPWDENLTRRLTEKCWCFETQILTAPTLISCAKFDAWTALRKGKRRQTVGRKQWIGHVTEGGYACWELNPSLRWTTELLRRVSEIRFDHWGPGWKGVAMNRGLPWSAALLEQWWEYFSEESPSQAWDFPTGNILLVENDQVWQRAFAPAVTESVLRRLLREA